MIINAFSIEKIGIGVLFVTLILLLAIIAYRKLLQKFNKGNVLPDKYCVLYSLEKNPASGILEFYFSTEEAKLVNFEILDDNYECKEIVASKEFKKGNHILRFDSTKLKNGIYYYQIRTENQKTYKKITIEN